MTTPIEQVKLDLAKYQYDPTGVQRTVLAMAKGFMNGDPFVDPTNPAVLCMESAAVLFSSFMEKNEINTRRQYELVAQTPEDLYLHMADQDYIGRFALPSTVSLSMLIAEDELFSRMIDDPSTKSRKVVIPRNTFFSVAGRSFSLQYPIIISQLQHGGLQIVYDVSSPTPLQVLNTNVIEWDMRLDGTGTRWVNFSFDLQQFSIISKTDSISSSKEFKLDIVFEQEYYYARVYVEVNTGWKEIATTHTDQVYDIASVTAVLRVVNKRLTVKIPQIYTNTLLASKKIRIDVYQTSGPLNLILSDYPGDSIGVTFINYDKNDDTAYTAPMRNFRQLIPYSDDVVRGGSLPLSFIDLRSRVLKNAMGNGTELPISNVQLETKLEKSGYGVVRDVDNITARVFLATKAMPIPSDTKLITSAAASMATVSIELDKAILLDTVINNGASITITPSTLYKQVNGVTTPASSAEVNQVLALPADKRASSVTQGNWCYTPFHYVLDTTGTEFDMRPYYLDAPKAITKLFVEENATTLLQVATTQYGVFRTSTGYTIQLITISSLAFRELNDADVYVQLAYIPDGEKDRAYLNGVYAGRNDTGERVYNFDVSSNFNVTSNDTLQLTKFLMFSSEPRLTNAVLTTDFDILYSVSTPMDVQWVAGEIDQVLGRHLLPSTVAGVAHEVLRIKFGDSLKTLWARNRSYSIGEMYQTHLVDVPLLYDNDVYRTDSDGSPIFFDDERNVVMTIRHHRNDPVYLNEAPLFKFRAGDIVTDANGLPVLSTGRGVRRMIDILLIDGVYWFATDASATAYRTELTQRLVSWLVVDLTEISKKVLEKTRIYFYPKTTMGMINVSIGDGLSKLISAGQSFKVVLQVTDLVYRNDSLKKRLSDATIKTISDQLVDANVSMSALNAALREQYGNDVIDVYTSGLGGSDNLSRLTVLDDANRCSISKRLVALSDGTLITEEDVTIEWVRV